MHATVHARRRENTGRNPVKKTATRAVLALIAALSRTIVSRQRGPRVCVVGAVPLAWPARYAQDRTPTRANYHRLSFVANRRRRTRRSPQTVAAAAVRGSIMQVRMKNPSAGGWKKYSQLCAPALK